jgi:acetyl-CoA carboxylase carboxyl transferase subunit beta
MLDLVEPRENLRNLIGKLLGFHAGDGEQKLPPADALHPMTDPHQLSDRSPWEIVLAARHIDRPTTLDYISYIFEDFEELHGDRLLGENSAVVGGLAMLGDLAVVVIGHQKGHSTAEMVSRNFGMPQPEGYRKAVRLMQHAAKFGMPVITLVDTPGAYPGIEAEERGQGVAIARSMMQMSRLPVPTVSVITGEGGSGGALALAVADRVLMMENAYYSVISPEGCSVILWKNVAEAPTAAAALKGRAQDLLRLRIIDGVVPEPPGGAHLDVASAAAALRTALIASLQDLVSLDPGALVEQRYRRFRMLGTPGTQPELVQLEAASS